MSTHINQIIQAQREYRALDEALVTMPRGTAERAVAEARYGAAQQRAIDITARALREGVDLELIQWAIQMHSDERNLVVVRAMAKALLVLTEAEEQLETLA